ncbi:hypothetical protein CPB86DRAFT_876552 [Serendipita vermifera]|nr:hypothetical protein CPB86DRAFT_876552 [Serendipita vermifera]
MSQPAPVPNQAHPISIVFLLHILLEGPICFVALVRPETLPFLEMNNTTIIMTKLYGAILLSTLLSSFLVWTLPEFLPGKRALALQLCLYHTVVSTALWHSPRFIPITLGSGPEKMGITVERLWCITHGLMSAALGLWWHITLPYTAAIKGGIPPSK